MRFFLRELQKWGRDQKHKKGAKIIWVQGHFLPENLSDLMVIALSRHFKAQNCTPTA